MSPAGTSNEFDAQNEWEENTWSSKRNNIGSTVYNVGEKLTVILCTYINRHAGPHRVSSILSERSPPLYCTLTLFPMQGHQNHNPFYPSRSSGLQ